MLKFCSQPDFLANSGFSKPAKIKFIISSVHVVFSLRENRSVLRYSAPHATFGHMFALHNQLRTTLTELTMGCVHSYPLFSFQGSICFSAAKIILSNLHFLVKYYFSYLIQFCLLFFSTANDILSNIILFVKHFFIYFFALVFAVYVSGYQYIICGPACQCFSFQTFAVDQCLYCFSDCFHAATFIYYTRLSENVNTFFNFFRYFFLPLKNKEKAALFHRNQSCLFFIILLFSRTYLSCLFYWFCLSFRFCRCQCCIPVQILFCSCLSGCSFLFCLFCYCFCR